MDQQQIQVNHGQSQCTFKYRDYDKLFNLQEFLRQQFKLAKFKLYYKEKDLEIYLESEKQYEEMISNGQVKQLYLKEDLSKEKNYLQLFYDQLFDKNKCCEKDNQEDCVICLDNKIIKPDDIILLVKECLYDLIKKYEFQAFCKKQFKREINDVDEFLEQFNKLSKPLKQIVQLTPQNQQLQQYNVGLSTIKQYQPNLPQQSQIIKQNQMRQSIVLNQQRQSEASKFQQQQSSKIGLSSFRQSFIQPQQYSIEFIDQKKDVVQEFQPETQIQFEVCIRNNGTDTWPDNVYLKQVGHHPEDKYYMTSLYPRQSKIVQLPFTTPLNPGKYYYNFVLFYQKPNDNKEYKIGERWTKEFTVLELSKQDKIQKSTDIISKKLSRMVLKSEIREYVANLVDQKEKEKEKIGISINNEILKQQTMSYHYVTSEKIDVPYKIPDISPEQCRQCGCYEKYNSNRIGRGSIILGIVLLPIALCWLPLILKKCQNQTVVCEKCQFIQEETPFLC